MNVPTILITGATDGIGLALARHYAATGARLLLHGRKPLPRLSAPLFTAGNYIQADLNQADWPDRFRHFFAAQQIDQLDLLIHNAGVGAYGRLADHPPLQIDTLLNVNLAAPLQLTHLLLPQVQRARGQIVFVSSVASLLPTPDYTVYTATKAALNGFARSLRVELGREVTVQVLLPGATRTGLHAKADIPKSAMNWEKFPSAADTAAAMARAIARKRPFVVIGGANKLAAAAGRLAPGLLDRLLARKMGETAVAAAAEPPTCLITGAADGIGKALAFRYAQAGYRILGVDVDAARAAHTANDLNHSGFAADFIVADLSSEQGVQTVLAALADQPRLDCVIHNAGISAVGAFAQQGWPPQARVLAVNLWAPLRLTAALLQENRIAAGGGFVFLSSLSRYVGYPGAAVYAASKDGVASFARQLRADLGRAHPVLTVYPGPTRTAHARRYSPDNSREASRMPPEQAADAIFHAAQRGQTSLIPGAGNKLFALIGTIVPAVTEQMLRKTLLAKMSR